MYLIDASCRCCLLYTYDSVRKKSTGIFSFFIAKTLGLSFVMNTHVVILAAAGQGSHIKSVLPKVLHSIVRRSILEHVLTDAEP